MPNFSSTYFNVLGSASELSLSSQYIQPCMRMPFETDINSGDVYSKQVWNHLKIKREPSTQLQNKFQLKISFHTEFNTNHSDHPDLHTSDSILLDTLLVFCLPLAYLKITRTL